MMRIREEMNMKKPKTYFFVNDKEEMHSINFGQRVKMILIYKCIM